MKIALTLSLFVSLFFGDFIDFYEQVGNNTNYTIHPEEILADNFALAIMEVSSLPSPWVVEEIRSKLQ